ncbi:hypothetical protein M9H77_30015 [Catharanthus roseus]|uniref:Uncharacterized protein n=1 Tax=Catharanthus roseus TaxID=4058 RepID=A0ACB9ZW30_CATRO|nr:hypothetical protein M9H77_30015 [Catharanthus roseus]
MKGQMSLEGAQRWNKRHISQILFNSIRDSYQATGGWGLHREGLGSLPINFTWSIGTDGAPISGHVLQCGSMGDRNAVVIARYEAGDDGSNTSFVPETSPSVSRTLSNEDTQSSKPEEGKRVGEDKQKRTVTSLFHDNRNPAKGITLHKVDFDDFMVEVEEEDVDDVIETWGYALVGFVAGGFPGIGAITRLRNT